MRYAGGGSRSGLAGTRLSLWISALLSVALLRLAVGGAVADDAMPSPMPLHPKVLAQLRAEGYDSVTVVDLQRVAARLRATSIDHAEQVQAPVTGSRPALVLLADFPDMLHQAVSTPAFYTDLLFSVGTHKAPGSMRDYYKKVSYGLFDVNPAQVDNSWRTVSHNHNYYANYDGKTGTDDDYGYGTYPNNSQGLVEEVVKLADPYVDFSSFAQNGQVQGLFVIHAGRGAETDPTHPDWIWSHKWALNEHALTCDGVLVNLYTIEPEYTWTAGDSTIGVYCHEFGHTLGLPDLYDTDGSSEGVGQWSLMAGGAWNGTSGDGDSPAMMDAWCRIQLGWIAPTRPTASATGLSVPASENTAVAYQVYPGNVAANQSFVIENRQRTSFDAALPGDGLLIYHVDESSWQENDQHPIVMVEQADGLSELQQKDGLSNAGDPYPGTTNNTSFTVNTNPNSRCYGGGDSQIGITNISPSSPTMSFDLSITPFGQFLSFPLDTNPGWTGQGQWAFGPPGGDNRFGDDPSTAHTGSNVFGYNLGGDYADNLTTTQYLTTTPIDCSSDTSVGVAFWRWLGVDDYTYDQATVQVSGDGGTTWTTIYQNPPGWYLWDGQWVRWFYDISPIAAGKSSVLLRWGMGPTDGSTTYCGWNIDDVEIWGLHSGTPTVDFSGSPTVGLVPLYVQFTDESTNNPTTWSWDFGDGSTAASNDPQHLYTRAGRRTVTLTAAGSAGTLTQTKTRYILVSFADVPVQPAFWALDQILACADAGIVAGFPDGTYGPALPVDRASMAVYLSRAIAKSDSAVPDGPTTPSFTDVPTDHWAYKYIEYVKSLGIVAGYPDGSYQPDEIVDRGQMAVYIARAIASPMGEAGLATYTPPVTPSFTDVGTDYWAYKYIEYCKSEGIVNGYADGSYVPGAEVMRDQMAVYVQRAFGLN